MSVLLWLLSQAKFIDIKLAPAKTTIYISSADKLNGDAFESANQNEGNLHKEDEMKARMDFKTDDDKQCEQKFVTKR